MTRTFAARFALLSLTTVGFACGTSSLTAPELSLDSAVTDGSAAGGATLSGGRTFAPPVLPGCAATGISLGLDNAFDGDGSRVVVATYQTPYDDDVSGCAAPTWSVSPKRNHWVDDKDPMRMLVSAGSGTDEIVYVTATLDTGKAEVTATLAIDFEG